MLGTWRVPAAPRPLGANPHVTSTKFADAPAAIQEGIQKYIEAVHTRQYPAPQHQYQMKSQ
jgi:ketopantoate hydroxymethyltransferase